jgi:hypothetical protein
MRTIMTSASSSPAVASRRAKNDDDFRVQRSLVHSCSTQNIDMAIIA